MNYKRAIAPAILSLKMLLLAPLAALHAADVPKQKPNILFIFADDLGYADVGFNGPDIKTPSIDMKGSVLTFDTGTFSVAGVPHILFPFLGRFRALRESHAQNIRARFTR
ncbi:MAG: hypothetical protein FJW31_22730 [Acidobacteria bacterium]|nr:hypothetical protein [Acidobacteriota bacterium]